LNAARRTPVAPGDTVALVGRGHMGLGMLQLLRLSGAPQLLAALPRAEARERREELGADRAAAPDGVPEDPALAEFHDWESGRGAPVVAEAGAFRWPGCVGAGARDRDAGAAVVSRDADVVGQQGGVRATPHPGGASSLRPDARSEPGAQREPRPADRRRPGPG